MGQTDYNGRLSLTQFEALIQPLVERMDAPVMKALADAGITKEQLGSVEIVGGATRQAEECGLFDVLMPTFTPGTMVVLCLLLAKPCRATIL